MLETWESLPAENCKSAACCFSILYSVFYHFKEIKVACAILKADKVDVFFDMLCHLSERMKWIYSWCCMVLSFEFLYSGFVNIMRFVTWTAFRQSFHKIMSMTANLTFEVLLLLTGNQTVDIFQSYFLHIVNTILRSLMHMQLVILFCSEISK